MRTTLVIGAALWLGLGPAGAAERAGGDKRGVLDGALRRGRLAASHSKPGCAGQGLERAPGVSRAASAVKNGVELLLTSADPGVAAKLQAEAPDHYARMKDADCGCCPAAVPGAKVKVKNVPGGVKVTMTSREPAAAEKLRRLAGVAAGRDGEGGRAPDKP